MMFNTIDQQGFKVGSLHSSIVSDHNRSSVVEEPVPETVLGAFERWRWIGNRWIVAIDYRGHSWYNPNNTEEVHTPETFDDAPPEGWSYWAPGENKVVLPGEVAAAKWAAIRLLRDQLLAKSDWVVIRATESVTAVDPQWIAYRQALRDITLQSDPDLLVWPLAPDSSNSTVFEVGAMP